MKNILIAGGSGLIGNNLSSFLKQQGHDISWLSRTSTSNKFNSYSWNTDAGIIDPEAFKNKQVLIQLAGSTISGGIWTRQRKQNILDSRLKAIQTIYLHLKKHQLHIPQIIQASAIGYYGDRGQEELDEYSKPGTSGFLASVCKQWESEAECLKEFTDQFSIIRTGLYLSPDGGIWPKIIQTRAFRFLVVFGKAQQYYSWIHHSDFNKALDFILSNKLSGIFNLTAPNPLSHADFMNTLKKQSSTKLLLLNAPEFVLKWVLGEQSQLVLDSAYVIPKRLREHGFEFQFSELQYAVRNLLSET